MKHILRLRSRRVVLAAGTLVLCILGSTLTSRPAAAYVDGCMYDPTVTLSNGVTVQLSALVYDVPTDVRSVSYVLHVPTGTTVTGVSYDANGSVESLQVYSDLNNGNYKSTTVAYTGTSSIAVTATDYVSAYGYLSQSGWSGNSLNINFMPVIAQSL